jgi:hypothetical protein
MAPSHLRLFLTQAQRFFELPLDFGKRAARAMAI